MINQLSYKSPAELGQIIVKIVERKAERQRNEDKQENETIKQMTINKQTDNQPNQPNQPEG